MTEVQTIAQTIAQRRGRYGPLIESGEVAMKLEDYLRSLPGWERLAYDQREALAMVAHKISRIMCGDPNYDDSWVDIAGYVQNVVNRLRAADQELGADPAYFREPAVKPAETFEASMQRPVRNDYVTTTENPVSVDCKIIVPDGADAKETGSLLSSEVKLK